MAAGFPTSVLLLGQSRVVSLLIATPLGIFAATRQYSPLDMATSVASYVGISVPSFVLGIFLLFAGGVWLRHLTPWSIHFPLFGMHTGATSGLEDLVWHMVLPVTSLSVLCVAGVSRLLRGVMHVSPQKTYVHIAMASRLTVHAVNY